MKRFFWRIFLSVWIVAVLTVTVTLFVAAWLPADVDEDARDTVDAVAAEVDELLAADPDARLGAAVFRHQARADGNLRVFLIDAGGRDALGRRLPLPVARWLRRANPALMDDLDWASGDPRLTFHGEAVRGYRVVAYRAGFRRPVGTALERPGGRLVALGTALAASVGVSFVLARFVGLPVRRLRRASRLAAGGDLGVRVAPTVGRRNDELARLARDFDLMTERVAGLVDARERLLRDVSHEFRSPLARLQAELSVARQRGEATGARLGAMEREIVLLDGLVSEILSFARLETQAEIRRAPEDLAKLVRGVAADAEAERRAEGKRVRVDAPPQCPAEIDGDLVRRAVENVVRNALRHGPEDEVVEIEVADSELEATIVVADRGPGVPEHSLDRLFDPFFRIGDAHDGPGGVGLAIAKRGIELHGGRIAAANRESGGLRVEFRLPKG